MTRGEMKAWLIEDHRNRVRASVAVLDACGVCWNSWALVHGFPEPVVTDLAHGRASGLKGESGRAAGMIIFQASLITTAHLDAVREASAG